MKIQLIAATLLLALLTTGCQNSSEATLQAAEQDLENREFVTAADAFSAILADDPANVRAMFGMSKVSAAELDWADAYAFAVRAASIAPDSYEYQRFALDLEIRARQWQLAVQRAGTMTFPEEQERLAVLATINLGLAQPGQALVLIQDMLEDYPLLLGTAALAANAAGKEAIARDYLEAARAKQVHSRDAAIAALLIENDLRPLEAWVARHQQDGDAVLILAENLLRSNEAARARAVIENSGELRFKRVDVSITLIEALTYLQNSAALHAHVRQLPASSASWEAAAAYGEGLAALLENQPDTARTRLKIAARVLPSRSRLHLTLGLLDYEAKDYASADAHLMRGLALNPNSAAAQIALIETKIQLNQVDLALSLHRAIRNRFQQTTELIELEAKLLALTGDVPGALALLDQHAAFMSFSSDARLLQAQLLLQDDAPAAKQRFKTLIAEGSKELRAVTGYIDSLLLTDDLAGALSYSRNIEDDLLRRIHALLLIRTGQYDEAVHWLELGRHPASADTLLLAAAKFHLGRTGDLPALAQNSDALVRTAVANYLSLAEDCQTALPIFRQALTELPDASDIHNGIAHCIAELGLKDEYRFGADLARRAYATDPDNETYRATNATFEQLTMLEPYLEDIL
jgi:predicted Zn-dependent protease